MATLAPSHDIAASAQNIRLELTRVIAAPRPRVFDAWTRPEMIRQWFGPEGMEPANVHTDPVVDGRYSIELSSCADKAAKSSRADGTYTEVSPYDLLQFTWVGDWVPDETSLVTLHFRDVDGGTEIHLIHDRFLSTASRDAHNKGWIACMDRLQAMAPAILAA